MRARILMLGLIGAALLCAGDKKVPLRSTENDVVEITATVLADREAVRQALGSDLGGHYIVVDVRMAPKDGRKITINRDDFLLRTDKDGERTTPFAPGQIAGKGALVVSTGASSGGTVMAGSPGGYGGYGPFGGGGIMGGGSEAGTETHATMKSG